MYSKQAAEKGNTHLKEQREQIIDEDNMYNKKYCIIL